MPQSDPAERVVDRREPRDDAAAALQLRLQFGKRDVGGRFDQSASYGARKAGRVRAARRVPAPCTGAPTTAPFGAPSHQDRDVDEASDWMPSVIGIPRKTTSG